MKDIFMTVDAPEGRFGRDRYSFPMMVLHWSIALGIGALLAIGWFMVRLPRGEPLKAALFSTHKSLGLTILTLILVRIVLRCCQGKPDPLPLPIWRRRVVHAVHGLLYLGMLATPIMGYVASAFNRYGVKWWGWRMPQWAAANDQLHDLFVALHQGAICVLAALIALHVAGAMSHPRRVRHALLTRMLPQRFW